MSDRYDEEDESEYSYTSSSEFALSSENERQANIQPEEDYFPPIVAIFYSIFHPTKGPTVIFQVPEGSIYSSSSSSKEQSSPDLETGSQSDINAQDASDAEEDLPRKRGQPPQAHAPLFDFRDLSEYIVPRAPLCGRLITYSTTSQEGQSYKVLSHPVLLVDQQKYPRNSFIFNLAFVFDGRADVRHMNQSMYELIEQLFEDLNSYYESFVALPEAPHSKYVTEAAKAAELLRDKRIFVPRAWNEQATQKDPATLATTAFAPGKREPPHGLGRTVRDAINVKLFPTYTNPKEVNDWDVPVTLLDLSRRISDNWDLTMRKVLPFVDGINHVKRISQLADADIELTRQCIEHLLYYRCIILIDAFQFTNMYTVRPTIAVLAEDEIIMNECAAYVTKRGYALPTWPKLLSLYSSLRPSVTLNEWIEENDIDSVGIDVRRFVTFGVIKGFLRRVHRYPVLLLGEAASQMDRLTGTITNAHQQRKTRATVIDVANVAFDTAARERQERQERSTSSITPQNTTKRTPLRRGASSSTIRASFSANRKNTYDEEYRKGGGSTSQNEMPKIPQGMIEMLDGNFPDDAFCVSFNRSWNDVLHLLIFIGLQSNYEQQVNTPGDLTPQGTLPRRGRQSSHQGSTLGGNEEQQNVSATGGAAPDESGFGQMSGFWGLGPGTGPPNTTAGQSNKRAGTLNALGPASTVTAFPSLPRYRTGSQGGQSGFSRYTNGTGGDSSLGGWTSSGRAGNSSINIASFSGAPIDDLGYEERKRILKGDLGRVQIIVK
ncbi:hypothetical protein L7F22_050255 [Adiantum nelumboides]|nr:hypothetical protein [Adiantum nelumboides]